MRSTKNETRQWAAGRRRTGADALCSARQHATDHAPRQAPPPPELRGYDYTRYWAARRRGYLRADGANISEATREALGKGLEVIEKAAMEGRNDDQK